MCFVWQPSVAGTHCFSYHVFALFWQPSVAGIHYFIYHLYMYSTLYLLLLSYTCNIFHYYHYHYFYHYVHYIKIIGHVIIAEEASSHTRTVDAFQKFNNCGKCGWRQSSSFSMQERKARRIEGDIILRRL